MTVPERRAPPADFLPAALASSEATTSAPNDAFQTLLWILFMRFPGVVDNRDLRQRYNGCGKSDWRTSAIAIAEAAALVRLSVGTLIVVRLSGAVHRHVMAVRRMA